MDAEKSTSFKCIKLTPRGNPFGVNYHYGIGAILVGHRCLIFGGYKHHHNRVPARFVYVYDTNTNSWGSVEPNNYALSFGQVKMSFLVEDSMFSYTWHEQKRIYQFANLNVVSLEEWALVNAKNMPRVSVGTAGCYVECRNEAILFGGGTSTEVHVFKVESRSWYIPDTKGHPPLPRENHALCSTRNVVFVAGGTIIRGRQDSPATKMLDLHLLTIEKRSFTWSHPRIEASLSGGYMPKRRYLFSMTCVQNRVFVFGGYAGKSAFDVYSIKSNQWFTRVVDDDPSDPIISFAGNWSLGTKEHAAVQTPQKLWIFGGFDLPPQTPLLITAEPPVY